MRSQRLDPNSPPPLGVTLRRDLPPEPGRSSTGADVAVYAGHADFVDICLFPTGPRELQSEQRIRLPHRRHGVHFGHIPQLEAGTPYGFRVHGPWEPTRGLRHNPAKLVLDPYARGISGELSYGSEIYAHQVGNTSSESVADLAVRDRRDSAPQMPRSVALSRTFDWAGDTPLRRHWSETVIYEAHVAGFTKNLPGVPAELRGTYAGLAHPASVNYLRSLGITALELLPVHAQITEPRLHALGLKNYWGYNTLGFFAPHAGYAKSGADPAAVLVEFKSMVRDIHQAGLEVILDVVYNHTCEQGNDGPMLCWRGLDNRAYYRLDHNGRDMDVTGCGNTLDFRHPQVVKMALDSLRYWVQDCHVDGFRFDLATATARGQDGGFHRDHPFLVALRTDPVLSAVKLIAEPWDVGDYGWRTGQFPPPLAEWNDRYRDGVRTFWLADAARDARGETGHGIRDLATRISGSQDLFGSFDRGPLASINYLAAHDGFTLNDACSYEHKHNQANGEGNKDGHGDNRSWNHGWEGPASDQVVQENRTQSLRNLLGTLICSTGVPMIAAGDEFGRTQRGNNNAYCQDNEISWVDWNVEPWQEDLRETTRYLLALRQEHPVLRQGEFFGHRPQHLDGTRDLDWFAADGQLLSETRWADNQLRTLSVFLHAAALPPHDAASHGPTSGLPQPETQSQETRVPRLEVHRSLLLVLQGSAKPVPITLPGPPWAQRYQLLWDSRWPRPQASQPACGPGQQLVGPRTVQLWAAEA